MAKSERNSGNVLRYTRREKSRTTVRRHYLRWRKSQGHPLCCDGPGCVFGEEPLIWNGGELPLILDHTNGVNSDDRPENLRLLCPNCNAQLDTHGGRNIGKVEKSDGGFAIVSKPTGARNYVLPAESPTATLVTLLSASDSSAFRISGADAVISESKEPGLS